MRGGWLPLPMWVPWRMALIDFTVSHQFHAPSRAVWDEMIEAFNERSRAAVPA